jgi:hypothetical protein
MAHEYLSKTRLVEEVPGAPDRYYIWHNRKVVWRGDTAQEGREWATANGISIEVFEPFEP